MVLLLRAGRLRARRLGGCELYRHVSDTWDERACVTCVTERHQLSFRVKRNAQRAGAWDVVRFEIGRQRDVCPHRWDAGKGGRLTLQVFRSH